MKRKIFYSFHYENDVNRVQQIRNMGVIEGNAPANVNKWEEVKQGGASAIKQWIDDNMANKSCVVVLVGEQTTDRKWIDYEIKKAWDDGKGLMGVYIHNIKCMNNGKSGKGANPFRDFKLKNGKSLSSVVECYNPSPGDAYNDIKQNIEDWIENAIGIRKSLA